MEIDIRGLFLRRLRMYRGSVVLSVGGLRADGKLCELHVYACRASKVRVKGLISPGAVVSDIAVHHDQSLRNDRKSSGTLLVSLGDAELVVTSTDLITVVDFEIDANLTSQL